MADNGRATTPEFMPSSPPAPSSTYLNSDGVLPSSPVGSSRTRKERRLPSVTPRRLGRFFTPRSVLSSAQSLPARQILGHLGDSAVNRQHASSPPPADVFSSDPIVSSPTERDTGTEVVTRRKRRPRGHLESAAKRRVLAGDGEDVPRLDFGRCQIGLSSEAAMGSDDNSSERRKATLSQFFKASRSRGQSSKLDLSMCTSDAICRSSKSPEPAQPYRPQPIRKFQNRGFLAQLLNREHGLSQQDGHHDLARPAADFRTFTAGFYSNESDRHQCNNYETNGSTVVFSQASAHTAPITAVGDEQGFIRLFNTSSSAVTKVDTHFKVHDNAVMDLAFSDDDMRLATACGDKTGRVVDVATQQTAAELEGGHEDSLRQIAFQPGEANGHVLATSDKAGRIRIWDLRCPSVPIGSFSQRTPSGTEFRSVGGMGQAQSTNCVRLAHSRTVHGITSPASIPAIQWFPGGRSHLLLSASEANAAIKLWDTRYIKPNRRQADDVPLTTTAQPRNHAWRAYGITSLTLNSDASRLYAVCRDSIVYAYSTAHLVLGTSTDLSPNGAAKHRPTGEEGLGPLYGFKNDAFRVNTFYVKSAISQSTATKPELLAVGSSEGSPILIPTDERYMRSAFARNEHILPASMTSSFSKTPQHSRAMSTASQAPSSLLPIYTTGTALVQGHTREVTTLSWSNEGKLVTASDDYVVRHWQEDTQRARHLRQVGWSGGERFMCGWAEVGEDWDRDDDDDE